MLKLLTSTAHSSHHANPSIRVRLSPVKIPLFNALTQLTGLNRSSHELGRRAYSSDQSEAASDSKAAESDSDKKSSSANASSKPNPESLMVIPLLSKPLLPGFYMPIYVKDTKLLEALQESRRQQAPYAGAFLLKEEGSTDSSSTSETENVLENLKGKELLSRIHEVGTLAKISSIQGEQVILIGSKRLRITEMVSEDPLNVKVDHLKDKPYDKDDDVIKATYFEVMSTLRDVLKTTELWKDQVKTYNQHISDFNYQQLADFGAGISGANKHQNQKVLEELDVHKRMELTLELMKKEVEINKIQASIKKTIDDKFSGEERRSLLKDQLKVIRKELGDDTDKKSSYTEKFRKRIGPIKKKIPKHVLKVIEEELNKLQLVDGSSSEFETTCCYLDWLTVLPWGNLSDENFDVLRAENVLEEDHYGLSDVKERILEFISVEKLRGTSQGKIICLSGPPGVGKTSIGRSIARALDRKFFQFSVGGLSNVSEIKGDRRVYVGSMPGKMVQCLKNVGTMNPLVLIDEIDKLGRSHQGDPASALLELLDPEQNSNFLDHYLNVTIDLSKVLFVCTANVTHTIPVPLLDRMEVITLAGYITDEKMHIARAHLEKNVCKDCGIKPGKVDVSDAALLSLIENYCRESGVRNLKNHIEKIYRKIARKLVREQATTQAAAVSDTDTEDTKPLAKTNSESSETSEEVSTVLTDESAAEDLTDSKTDAVSDTNSLAKTDSESSETSKETSTVLTDESGTEDSTESKTDAVSDTNSLAKTDLESSETSKEASTVLTDESGTEDSAESKTEQSETVAETIEKVMIDESNLSDYVGKPVFHAEKIYEQTPVGVVMGLAWTSMGGSTLYIETTIVEEEERKGCLRVTGRLGKVMKESAQIAHTVARKIMLEKEPENTFFANSKLHLHVPEGATPKDGPSAGCTMITSLLSLAMKKPVRKDFAMTGEVTLTGRILPIGGVKEKTIGARRSQVKMIIFPEANRRDFDELPENVKEGLVVRFVDVYEQIFELAFGCEHDH